MRKKYAAGMTAVMLAASVMMTSCGGSSASTEAETESTTAESAETETESSSDTAENASDSAESGASDGQVSTGGAPDGQGGPLSAPDGQGGPGGAPGGQGGPGGAPGGQGGTGGAPGGGSSQPESYDAERTITSDTTISGETITSDGTDENAVLVQNGAKAELDNVTITRDSDDSTGGDSSSFYGVGAAVLVTDGTAVVKDSEITSDAKGGAGVFAYGDGTAYVENTKITTAKDTSGGIHAAGGGTLYAWDCDVTTSGESSAAIRSDRGGGKIVVDGGTYTSNGSGSPAVYSTADIAIQNAVLTANGSEAICIEGDNQIRLFDCNLTGNMSDLEGNGLTWNVILYQSMSGDSEEGNSTFEMDGGSLTAKNGGMFYSTNTESTFTLRNVDITYAPENDFFLRVTGNSNSRGWGSSGANGADTTFTGISQKMEGDVIWDSISKLDFYMTEGSSLTGAVVDDESDAGDGGDGYANVYIDSTSTWTVTGDSTLTALYNEGTIQDADGKTVTVKGTDGTVYVQGDSSYTITVSSYSDSADLSGAGTMDSFSSYAVEKI